MVIRDFKVHVFDAKEETFVNKNGETVKFCNCKIKGDIYDNYYKINCDKVVPDGVYTCALRLQYDFEKKKDIIKLYVVGD